MTGRGYITDVVEEMNDGWHRTTKVTLVVTHRNGTVPRVGRAVDVTLHDREGANYYDAERAQIGYVERDAEAVQFAFARWAQAAAVAPVTQADTARLRPLEIPKLFINPTPVDWDGEDKTPEVTRWTYLEL